jgi:hypothetical protein
VEEDIAMEYLMEDIHQSVIWYAVDMERSNINKTYNESRDGGIVFKQPVEVPCLYKIDPPDLKAYDQHKNLGLYSQTGILRVNVMNKTIEELNADIKRGDYIGVIVSEHQIKMFSVVDDGRVNNDNRHSMYGLKPYYRTILAAEVDKNEFDGK